MTIDYIVPFYSNTPDNTHCWQAALKMVIKYFQPDKEYSWEELDKYTEKIGDLWTWPSAGTLWLSELGYLVKDIEVFDYKRFVTEGTIYIYKEFGEEVGKAQEMHADMKQGVVLAKKLIERSLWTKEIPTLQEIKTLLNKGYLVICNINAQTVNNKQGYVGHFVVVKGFDDNQLILHDPGSPPQENRKINYESFEKAWAYPNEKAKNLMAFKLLS